MGNAPRNTGLIIAIVFAAISISAALVFFGLQLKQPSATKASMDDTQLAEKIAIGIEQYVQKQMEARRRAQSQARMSAAEKAKNVRRVSATRDHIYGNSDAKISLIEYSDFECPFCKRFHPTAKHIVDAYDGKVNWVYRHFPLAFHNPGAQKQAEASECANEQGGNEAFWNYADAIYARTKSNGKGFPLGSLVPLATEIGLDAKKFQECLDTGRYTARVKEDFNEGARIGISGTPGNVLLNNETGAVTLTPGAVPFAALKGQIDQLLN
ncbi:MAG: DsbA family protein [Acidiferrobacterales bacterium]